MNASDSPDRPEAALHAAVWAAIPWCVAGTASAEEQARALAHLEQCADCRNEWALNQRLQRGLQLDTEAQRGEAAQAAQADAGLRRLWARMDADAAIELQPQPPARASSRPPSRSWLHVLAAAAVLQALGLATLAALWWQGGGEGTFQTLGHEAGARPLAVQQRSADAARSLQDLQAEAAREGLVVLRVEPRRDAPGWTVHLAAPAPQR
jgi:hypothetical protein